MSNITTGQAAEIESATEAIRFVDRLLENPDFATFMDYQKRQADKLADAVLHDDMKPKAREALRQQRKGMLSILGFAHETRKAQVKVLKARGIDYDSKLPGE